MPGLGLFCVTVGLFFTAQKQALGLLLVLGTNGLLYRQNSGSSMGGDTKKQQVLHHIKRKHRNSSQPFSKHCEAVTIFNICISTI